MKNIISMKELFVNVVIRPLAGCFTYRIPKELSDCIQIGHEVKVPLGKNRIVTGFVVKIFKDLECDYEIKNILGLVHPQPGFTNQCLELYQWMSEYYLENLSVVIDTAIPAYHPPKKTKLIGLVDKNLDLKSIKTTNQKKLIKLLIDSNKQLIPVEQINSFKNLNATITQLVKKNLIKTEFIHSYDDEDKYKQIASWAKTTINLNQEQLNCYKKLVELYSKGNSETVLLHGITGSGKTEVYIEIIKFLIEKDKSSIVLVPEIALTPQLTERFFARFGNQVALIHSGLSNRQRWGNWQAIMRGEKKIIIGARSALFAPVSNLGLIVVDEEHDNSFKQSEGLRYNARDLCYVKAKQHKALLLLGSATPSLETYYKSLIKEIHYLTISHRHKKKSKLDIEIVDMNKLKPWDLTASHISTRLYEELLKCLQNKEQAFILFNRRGYSHYVQCEKCETCITCPNCALTLTYHQKQNALLCHSCSFSMITPTFCPSCQKNSTQPTPPGQLSLRGSGTEKAEDELARIFPDAKILRLDRDVASKVSDYKFILDQIRTGQADFLVGTQMIAKGHDLPNVTLAAVIDCDVGLHMPDFRASERVFQLLSQLAGRAGRGEKPGKVILQTRVPKSHSIVCTQKENYHEFASSELSLRKNFNYPPFGKLLRIIATSTIEDKALHAINRIRKIIERYLEKSKDPIQVLGPSICAISKLKSRYRYHILLKASRASYLIKLGSMIKKYSQEKPFLKITLDMDPIDML